MRLVDFLLARIAEDAAAARDANIWRSEVDCEAKRRIVEEAAGQHTSSAEGYDILRIMATVYADHPDYDESWRP